jgi:hypothetical protein
MQFLPDNCAIVPALPVTRGVAAAGDWVCLKGYAKAMCIINIVTGADDTELTFTVDKATSVAGGDESTGITLNRFWTAYNVVSAAPVSWALTKGTAAASIATVTDQSTSHLIVIDIDAAELPTATYAFDCVQLTVAGGNAAHSYAAIWVLYNPRNAQDQASMLSAIAD